MGFLGGGAGAASQESEEEDGTRVLPGEEAELAVALPAQGSSTGIVSWLLFSLRGSTPLRHLMRGEGDGAKAR